MSPLMLALLVQATPLVVSPRGPFTTVASAVAAARSGAEITVQAGRYHEPLIVVDRAVTISGEPGAVLDGEGTHPIMVVHADNVTITGLAFTNTGIAYKDDRAALRVADVSNCQISGNRFDGTFFAIYLAPVRHCVVSNNIIVGVPTRESAMGNGIHLWSSRYIYVGGNQISGQRDGIYLEFTRHADVRDNVSERNVR